MEAIARDDPTSSPTADGTRRGIQVELTGQVNNPSTDWTLWEDFGVISGNHAAVLPLSNEGDRQFYKLESYQP